MSSWGLDYGCSSAVSVSQDEIEFQLGYPIDAHQTFETRTIRAMDGKVAKITYDDENVVGYAELDDDYEDDTRKGTLVKIFMNRNGKITVGWHTEGTFGECTQR